jgi:putative phage-type endonuclease
MDTITMNELEPLKNIFEKINPPLLIPEDEIEDFIISCCEYLYDYCITNPKIFCTEKYDEELNNELDDYIYSVLDNIDNDIDYEDQINDIKYDIFKQFYSIIPKRSKKSNPITFIQNSKYKDYIEEKINIIYKKNKEQPEQRTKEWFEQRHNLLSASSLWKALDKENYKNALVYEKCKPIDTEKFNNVNINSPLHWGQKYEPVSQMYYEYKYDAKIDEFGCISHSKYKFLGASPDGINIKKNSERYGRMLEIKNIVNREITGKPKKEYWIQTQLQMECCDLEECDFLECRFKEYVNEEEFRLDGSFEKTKNNKCKGIIVQFYHNNKPYYEYAPFQCSEEEFNIWYENIIKLHEGKSWVSNIYWYLDEVSCVLIERNKLWFNCIIKELEDLWNTIEKERISGYEHRKPEKQKKTKEIIVEKSKNSLSTLLTKQLDKDIKNIIIIDI